MTEITLPETGELTKGIYKINPHDDPENIFYLRIYCPDIEILDKLQINKISAGWEVLFNNNPPYKKIKLGDNDELILLQVGSSELTYIIYNDDDTPLRINYDALSYVWNQYPEIMEREQYEQDRIEFAWDIKEFIKHKLEIETL